MRSLSALCAALAFVSLSLPGVASAQEIRVGAGAFGTHSPDVFDGSTGVGALVLVELPALPLDVRGFGERYFPDCGQDDEGAEIDGCAYWGYGLDVALRLPVPALNPYLTAGVVYRFFDTSDLVEGETQSGAALGGGIEVPVGDLRLFGEARWESIEFDPPGAMLPEPVEQQWIFRVGLTLDVR